MNKNFFKSAKNKMIVKNNNRNKNLYKNIQIHKRK